MYKLLPYLFYFYHGTCIWCFFLNNSKGENVEHDYGTVNNTIYFKCWVSPNIARKINNRMIHTYLNKRFCEISVNCIEEFFSLYKWNET